MTWNEKYKNNIFFIVSIVSIISELGALFYIIYDIKIWLSGCNQSKVYTYGVLSCAVSIFLAVYFSFITFSVRRMRNDHVLSICAIFALVWGAYGIANYILGNFVCLSNEYPLRVFISICFSNFLICLFITHLGSKYAHHKTKKQFFKDASLEANVTAAANAAAQEAASQENVQIYNGMRPVHIFEHY